MRTVKRGSIQFPSCSHLYPDSDLFFPNSLFKSHNVSCSLHSDYLRVSSGQTAYNSFHVTSICFPLNLPTAKNLITYNITACVSVLSTSTVSQNRSFESCDMTSLSLLMLHKMRNGKVHPLSEVNSVCLPNKEQDCQPLHNTVSLTKANT